MYFLGKGVLKAVANVNEVIADELIGMDGLDQVAVDQRMLEIDGTPNKAKLGANAILGVSLATAHAAARYAELPLFRYLGGSNARLLPAPMMNILNGGEHADNSVDIQEFMVMPLGLRQLQRRAPLRLRDLPPPEESAQREGPQHVGRRRGGFAPNLGANAEAFDVILTAIEKAGYKPGEHVWFAMDCAATEFYDREKGVYTIDGKEIDSAGMVDLLTSWVDKHPICSIEDGCDEDDWEGWKMLTAKVGDRCQLVGDDLFVTNVERLQRGIDENVGNSILIKVNQIGSLTETIDAIKLADVNGYTSVTSHRSGETEDSTIADLAVALGTGQIKTGSASRSDRMAKYNQLLRIEEQLGGAAQYGGPALAAKLG